MFVINRVKGLIDHSLATGADDGIDPIALVQNFANPLGGIERTWCGVRREHSNPSCTIEWVRASRLQCPPTSRQGRSGPLALAWVARLGTAVMDGGRSLGAYPPTSHDASGCARGGIS